MRLLHTSDWHLGRRLHGYSLLEEQAYALERMVEVCRSEGIDALLIAGDVFDRAVPPEEAVALFSDFLHRMAREVRIPVVAISGNHDSAERLGFGAELLATQGMHLRTRFARRELGVLLEARDEQVQVFALPYVEPAAVRSALGNEAIRTHDEAVRAALSGMRVQAQATATPSVLLAHLFAVGATESPDSERTLEIGGAAQVELATLEGFSYVALGHLHAPQRVGGREAVRYSGSMLKYAVSEASQRKGVTVVEMEAGAVRVEELTLAPRRDVVRLEASLQSLLESPEYERFRDDYVEATYTDLGYHLDVASRLKARFPRLLTAIPGALTDVAAASPGSAVNVEAALRDTRALLEGFWGHVLGDGEPLEEGHHALFGDALGAVVEGVGPPTSAEGRGEGVDSASEPGREVAA